MKITINEVAKKANVSKTTISRYLNGKYKYMSNETKEKIKNVIEELEYIPNGMARSIKNKQSKIIGLTIADMDNQFSTYIFKGISEICKKKGYRLLVTEINGSEEDEIEAIDTLISYNIDGLIINTTGSNDDYIIKLKNEKSIPIVLADRSIYKSNIIDTVTSNNYSITYETMEHLHENNYDLVAFFSYALNNNIRNLRYKAYFEALKNIFDISEDKYTYIYDENCEDELEDKLGEYLNSNKDKRKAIFCMNGKVLLQILKALKRKGYDIERDDIGICSFDDWGWVEIADKNGITAINQKSYECGKRCAELIFDRIENKNKEIEYIELPAKLIVRGSTTNRRNE
ncbi:LacI family DNA-binding transcriptional regulator [Oceanivirga salmonicida]|uniref:LacI family DNA-binding transcriptional regulator n=1 Tax=Oceanivirga salmonicida TaxID=1769291 RepID=UPI0012E32CCF|nr:LacI family DNA-binding transcriptional regulator [Oceanivirga salmonicida]